jgi:hypothetical protein
VHRSDHHAAANGNGHALAPPPLPDTPASPRKRHDVRPPVEHAWGCGPLPHGFDPAPVRIFRHPLLQQVRC